MKIQSILKVSAIAGALIALYGCNNDGMFTDTLSNIDHLQVSALNVPLGEFNAGDQVAVGYPLQYQATLVYNDGTPSEDVTDSVVWTTDNTTATSIDADGVVEGLESGNANISATYEALTSNASPLTITDETASELRISGRKATVNGIPVPFTATAVFSDGTQQDLSQFVSWSSSDTNVGAFSDSENSSWFIPVASGSAVVTATYSATSLTSATPITEYVLNTSDIDSETPVYLTLNPTTSTLVRGTSEQYKVMAKINTIDTAPQLAPFNITAFLDFESSDSNTVALEETTNADGEAVIRAKALKVSDGVTITASGTLNGTTYSRSGTLTVTDTTVSSIAVDCGDASMAAGLDISCTATATFSPEPDEDIIINDDLTESVVWSSGDTSVMTASTTTPGVFTGIAAGSADAIAMLAEVSGRTGVTVNDSTISAITITNTETTVNAGETLQMNADGTTTLGAEDVTSRVTWSTGDSGSSFSGETAGLLTAESGVNKTITITASAGTIEDAHALTINFILSYCGTGLDDTDLTSATGACLKTATDSFGNWFTSTPSIAVMIALSYQGPDDDASADSSTNSGDTYAGTYIENGTYGPDGGLFAVFRQDGADADGTDGTNGQFYRWCQKLASLNFAGRNDWRRPTISELNAFYQRYEDEGAEYGLWSARGWPTRLSYFSSTVDGLYYDKESLYDGPDGTSWASNGYYASCVSVNP